MSKYKQGTLGDLHKRQDQSREARTGHRPDIRDDGDGGLVVLTRVRMNGVTGYRVDPVEVKDGKVFRKVH